MRLDEQTRHHVFGTLRERLDETTAVVLMSAIPPFDWSEVALKSDLAAMEERTNSRFGALEQRIDTRFEVVGARMQALEQRMDDRFKRSDERLTGLAKGIDLKLEAMEQRLTAAFERGIRRALVAQTFTVFGGVVGLYVLAERFAG